VQKWVTKPTGKNQGEERGEFENNIMLQKNEGAAGTGATTNSTVQKPGPLVTTGNLGDPKGVRKEKIFEHKKNQEIRGCGVSIYFEEGRVHKVKTGETGDRENKKKEVVREVNKAWGQKDNPDSVGVSRRNATSRAQ